VRPGCCKRRRTSKGCELNATGAITVAVNAGDARCRSEFIGFSKSNGSGRAAIAVISNGNLINTPVQIVQSKNGIAGIPSIAIGWCSAKNTYVDSAIIRTAAGYILSCNIQHG
jgi:hypothetical protein